MKIKTAALERKALNWAVAVASGMCWTLESFVYGTSSFSPSTDWEQGGPIIEREKITLIWRENEEEWSASLWLDDATPKQRGVYQYGPTPLIAAMRCFVASKLGDEVDIPEELT